MQRLLIRQNSDVCGGVFEEKPGLQIRKNMLLFPYAV